MSNYKVARRYAEACMDFAEEQKQLDRVAKDLQVVQRLAKDLKDFALFLKSPVINKARKKAVFAELFASKMSKSTLSLFSLLTEKGREEILVEIIDQFFALRDERLGIVHVEVKGVAELTAEQNKRLQERLESYTKKKVRFSFRIDKQLKGGFVAKVGDTVFDGSVKRQLELMKDCFVEGTMSN